MTATSNIKRDIKDVVYLVALQGLNYIVPLLVLPYLMKTLGAGKFGYIGFSLSVVQYLMLIVDFGFNLSATKRIALAKDNPKELNRIFNSTLYAKTGLLILSFFILLIVAAVPRFELYRSVMFVMFLTVIANTYIFTWLFQGMGQIRNVAIFSGIAKLLVLPLTFLLVKTPDDYMIAASLQAAVIIVAMIISIIYVIKQKWVQLTSFICKDTILELKEAYPLFLSNAAVSIYLSSFVLILGYFATPEDVGQYSAVEKIMRAFCMLIFIPVSQVFYPKISAWGASSKIKAVSLIKKLLAFEAVCMFAVLLAMFFLSPYAIEFLGDDYKGSLMLFRIMAFVPLFVGCGGVFAQLVILALGNSADKQYYQRVYFIAGVVALAGALTSIPFFAAKGAAVVLLFTEMLVCILMCRQGVKILNSIKG